MSELMRILLVEDPEHAAAIASELLPGAGSWQFEVANASTLKEALRCLADEPFQAVLLSLTLPDSDGLDTLRAVRQAADSAPIVVLAPEEDADMAMASAQEGAEDYVIKGQFTGAFLRLMVLCARERHRSRRQLRSAHDLLRSVLDNIPDAIYVKDDMGRKVLANSADLAHVGAAHESEVLNKTDSEVVGSELAAQSEAHDLQVLRDGQPVIEQEELGKHADGSPSWGLTTKIPLTDATGRVTGLVGISRDITARKRTEEQLRESERRYRTILDTALDGFWLVDTQGLLLEVNEAYSQMSGYSRKELLTMAVPDLEIIETSGEMSTRMQALMTSGEDRFETQHRRKDGSILDAEVALSYSPMDGGRVVTVLRDITERKRAEELLRQSELRYRTMLETALDGFCLVDAHGRLLEVNKAYCQMTGYSRVELLSMHVTDLDINESAGQVASRLQALTVSGEDRFLAQHRRKDGTRLDVEIALSRSPTDSGHTTAIVRDITEHKRAGEQLRQSEHRYRTILQTALDGFWLVDTQGRLLEVNEAYCHMSGYSRDELLTMHVPDVEILEAPGDVDARIQAVMIQGEDRFETQHRRKDGSILDVEIALRYNHMEGGRIVSIVRDITARKVADQALRQAHKMEAVGQLAGGIAHDLNNMLSVINGYSQMALDVLPQSNPLYADISEIKSAGDRSAQLTRQLLTFARRQAIAPRMLNLNATTEEMLSMLRRLVGENVKLAWEPGKELWPVRIDPGQVDQILANLVVNARDAITGVGTITIATANADLSEEDCRALVDTRPGQYVMISVTDDGGGMSEDVLEHIFEPFFTTKPVGQGTGLGLATVYGITKQNGGCILVSSGPGGTTFCIYIPRHVTVDDTAALDPELAEAPRGTETVLVVEDEVALLQLVRRILEPLGYTVLSADTPHEALRLVATYEGQIDLLLTDVVMPGMGGRQLQQALATTNPSIRWRFMSGYTANALNQQGVHDNDPHLLPKPFTQTQLAHYVRAALDER